LPLKIIVKKGEKCLAIHKNKSELMPEELKELEQWESKRPQKKPKKKQVPWSGPCFYFNSKKNPCNNGDSCKWEHKNRNNYTPEEESAFLDPNSNGWKRTYKPKPPPPSTTPTPTPTIDPMVLLLAMINKEQPKIELHQTTQQTVTQSTQSTPGWWNGSWGSWNPSWAGRTPTYCVHGSAWSHCYTGPPYHCVHGSRWGSCCCVPF